MKKMGKREKIILALLALAVLYGAYALFFESSAKTAKMKSPAASNKEEMTRLDALVTSVGVTLKDSRISPANVYIIEHAVDEWEKDPFYAGNASVNAAGEETISFSYTGYLDLGTTKLAIINGIDYRIGEELESPGFVLRRISSSQVVIEDKEGLRRLTIPFVEE
jgi:hypothetical protein